MKNENAENIDDLELQKELNERLQNLIDRKKSESEALQKMLKAILEKDNENQKNNEKTK